MGTQLNIKSDDAYRLASELAELTGENLTMAVTAALRERLERQHRARDRQDRVDQVLAIAREIRAHLPATVTSDHSWLYDEDGLLK